MTGGWRVRVPLFAAALWWGGLTALAGIAVPLLFMHLPSPATAGQLAARLFSATLWLALGSGVVLLASSRNAEDSSLDWGRGALPFVLAGMLLALLVEFAVAPRIVTRQDLAFWHRLGSGMLAAEWFCAGAVLWKLAGGRLPG